MPLWVRVVDDPHDAGVLIEKFGEEVPLDVQRAGEDLQQTPAQNSPCSDSRGGSCLKSRRRIGQDIGLERGRCERLAVIGRIGHAEAPKASCSLMSTRAAPLWVRPRFSWPIPT